MCMVWRHGAVQLYALEQLCKCSDVEVLVFDRPAHSSCPFPSSCP